MAFCVAVPFTYAGHVEVGAKDNGFSVEDERYLTLYERAHKAGYDVGRNLLDCAWKDTPCVPDERVAESAATLDRWLNPPEPEPVEYVEPVETTSYSAPAPAPAASSGSCSYPGVELESGGSWTAVNPSSGAYGCFQQMPMHREPGGLCEGMGTDPSGQIACNEVICAEQGNAAWAASGAAPC